jgi:hypothetical protein
MYKSLALKLCLFCAIFLSGCINFATPVTHTAIPKKNCAYIYGRFEQIKDPNCTVQAPIGLVISSPSGTKAYVLRFLLQNNIYAVEIEPGQYSITKWLSAYIDGSLNVEQSLENQFQENSFNLEPGKAYYLGDFRVYTIMNSGLFKQTIEDFIFEIPENCFDKTTREFLETYPGFAEISKIPIFKEGILKSHFNKRHIIRLEIN